MQLAAGADSVKQMGRALASLRKKFNLWTAASASAPEVCFPSEGLPYMPGTSRKDREKGKELPGMCTQMQTHTAGHFPSLQSVDLDFG